MSAIRNTAWDSFAISIERLLVGMAIPVILMTALAQQGCTTASRAPERVSYVGVADLTATLTAQQTADLQEELAALELRDGVQIIVLMVSTTAPESIENYSVRVASERQRWREGARDRALLVVAKDDRKLRIEVSDALSARLTDEICKEIIDTTIVPYFRQGDFFGGIKAGIAQMGKHH